MSKRGAIGLPVEILVVIILSLVIVGMSITFLYNSMETSGKAKERLDQQATAEMEQLLLDQGAKVALPLNVVELKSGEKHIFNLVVFNSGEDNNFRLTLEPSLVLDELDQPLSPPLTIAVQEWIYSPEPFLLSSGSNRKVSLFVHVPEVIRQGTYIFAVKVYDSSSQQYGATQRIQIKVPQSSSSYSEPLPSTASPELPMAQDCRQDLSCEYYFIYVPIGSWPAQGLFEAKAEERFRFFQDVTKFKFKTVGAIYLPLDFAQKKCDLSKINPESASDHLKLKKCADLYADSLGLDYEKAIGLSNTFSGGKAFFREKAVYSTLGFSTNRIEEERPGIAAHELGHSYSLCDEYSYKTYQVQDRFFKSNTCKNKFPESCNKNSDDCLGHTPTYRDYNGAPVLNVCNSLTHYTLMGFSTGAECGFDATGGYEAIGDFP